MAENDLVAYARYDYAKRFVIGQFANVIYNIPFLNLVNIVLLAS